MDKNKQPKRDQPAAQKTGNRDPKTESRTQRPEDIRTAGRTRGEGSDDHRSGSESGKH